MTTEVQLHARLYWKLVFEYYNVNNPGTITQTYFSRTYTSATRSTFGETVARTTTDTLQKEGVSAEVGVSYGPVSAKVSASYESSREVNEMLQDTTKASTGDVITTEQKFERKYTVGPNGKLNLYQQCFEGPGMSAAFDVFSTDPARANQSEDVIITVTVKPTDFISELQVVYTISPAEAPADRLRDINGSNGDVNQGFLGSYVWLVPQYTHDSTKAVTIFDFVNQNGDTDQYSDLAKGSGGQYRFLIPAYISREEAKITQCALLRGEAGAYTIDQVRTMGWTGMSADINRGRKGDHLYLVWKTRNAY